MLEVYLFTKQGEYVATVMSPPFPDGNKPDVILWGDRTFMRNNLGQYIECFMFAAWTKDQWEEMKQQGK